jgi:hypothetical protein
MKHGIIAGLILTAWAVTAIGQDWYHEREERFRGEAWKPHVFMNVKDDLDHVWSAFHASDKERKRIERTKDELTKMQEDLDHGRWDNGLLNDSIDSIRKSSNDQRLAPPDRQVLADDVIRLKDYQDHHNQWPH